MSKNDNDSNLWRNLALVAVAGAAAYGVYKLLSNPKVRAKISDGYDAVKDRAQDGFAAVKKSAHNVSDAVKDQAGKVRDTVKRAAGNVLHVAQDEAETVANNAKG